MSTVIYARCDFCGKEEPKKRDISSGINPYSFPEGWVHYDPPSNVKTCPTCGHMNEITFTYQLFHEHLADFCNQEHLEAWLEKKKAAV